MFYKYVFSRLLKSAGATLPVCVTIRDVPVPPSPWISPSTSVVVVPSAPGTSRSSRAPSSLSSCQLGSSRLSQPCMSATAVSAWLASSCLSVWNLKSHRIFALLFSTTVSGVSLRDSETSNPNSAQMFVYNSRVSWLCIISAHDLKHF